MAKMFGYIGNRSDLFPLVLSGCAPLLRLSASGSVGWGFGFYQSGEVLLRRRPVDQRPTIDLAAAMQEVRSDLLLAHLREPTIGGLRTENTHPFRYRLWLHAQGGATPAFERMGARLLDTLPQFLRSNVRGETDAEATFYLILSFLHDAGDLGEGTTRPAQVAAALRSAVTLIDRLSAEEGCSGSRGDILLSNGEQLFAVHRSGTMAHRVLAGERAFEELGAQRDRLSHLSSAKGTVVTSGITPPDATWETLAVPSIVTFHRGDAPSVDQL